MWPCQWGVPKHKKKSYRNPVSHRLGSCWNPHSAYSLGGSNYRWGGIRANVMGHPQGQWLRHQAVMLPTAGHLNDAFSLPLWSFLCVSQVNRMESRSSIAHWAFPLQEEQKLEVSRINYSLSCAGNLRATTGPHYFPFPLFIQIVFIFSIHLRRVWWFTSWCDPNLQSCGIWGLDCCLNLCCYSKLPQPE